MLTALAQEIAGVFYAYTTYYSAPRTLCCSSFALYLQYIFDVQIARRWQNHDYSDHRAYEE